MKKAYLYDAFGRTEYMEDFKKYKELSERLEIIYGKSVEEVEAFVTDQRNQLLYAKAQDQELKKQYALIKNYMEKGSFKVNEDVLSFYQAVGHGEASRNAKLTWEYLKENGMLTDEMMEYLTDRILAGYGFLISGRGGSGKSTLLNNMLDWIPFDQSILVSQESDELYSNVHPQIQFEHTMTVRKKEVLKEFTLEDELRLGLLQDIDNFIIGEIKGGEALHVFTTAMSTGARFFGTIHSNDARSSVTRLAQCARYVSDYPMETLEEMLTCMPFVLIHMSRFSIDEIVEIDGWDAVNKRLLFSQVYEKEVE